MVGYSERRFLSEIFSCVPFFLSCMALPCTISQTFALNLNDGCWCCACCACFITLSSPCPRLALAVSPARAFVHISSLNCNRIGWVARGCIRTCDGFQGISVANRLACTRQRTFSMAATRGDESQESPDAALWNELKFNFLQRELQNAILEQRWEEAAEIKEQIEALRLPAHSTRLDQASFCFFYI